MTRNLPRALSRLRRVHPALALAWLAFAASLALFAVAAARSPAGNFALAERDRELRTLSAGVNIDMTAEEQLARAYWTRYPDVAADSFYGMNGRLGIMGAREHYAKHGRREGRLWRQ